MSEISIPVGRRSYAIACADGQEDRVRALGAEVDERLRRLGANVSVNDTKNILIAAIMLADELQHARAAPAEASGAASGPSREAVATLEEQLLEAREENERLLQHLANANTRLAHLADDNAASVNAEPLAEQAEALAALLEKCAARLEHRARPH